jgi:SHS2 domain-containing protein
MTHRFLPHTADILVEIDASTLEEVFEESTVIARGLLAGDSTVAALHPFQIRVSASGPDELLHHYLRELLSHFQVSTFVPAQIEVLELTPTSLVALVLGELFDERRHEPQPEVKAVTRHGLSLVESASGWRGTLVFDM